MTNRWRDTKDAAAYIGFQPKTLENWRAMTPPRGPAFRKVGRAIRYDVAELDRFMEAEGAAA